MYNDDADAPDFAKYAASPAAFSQISAPGSLTPAETLVEFGKDLETWAVLNEQDARRDSYKFWALKIPAILVSAGAGVFAYFKLTTFSAIAGAVGSMCVLLDGLLCAGTLRNVHVRAFHDLRNLESEITRQWQIGCFHKKDQSELAAQILQDATNQRQQIEAYLRAAESSLPETKSKSY